MAESGVSTVDDGFGRNRFAGTWTFETTPSSNVIELQGSACATPDQADARTKAAATVLYADENPPAEDVRGESRA